jgi:hypothetical protein
LRECLEVDKDIVGNTSGDFRKLFCPKFFVNVQPGYVRIIFYCTCDTCNNVSHTTAIHAEGFIYAHRLGKQQASDDASRQDYDKRNYQKNCCGTDTGAIPFLIEPFIERPENTRNDSCPENRRKKRREEIKKQERNKDQRREKKYILDFRGMH